MNIINHELVNLINGAKEKPSWKIYNAYENEFINKLETRNDEEIKEFLLKRFSKEDFLEISIIYELITHKRISLLEQLHQNDYPMTYEEWDGGNALHVSCVIDGSLDAVKFLMENNICVDINKKTLKNETPLSLARHYKHKDILEYFKAVYSKNGSVASVNKV